MKTYQLKRQYCASRKVLALFKAAFILTALGFLLEISVALFQPEGTYTFGSALMTQLLFWLLFVIVAILVVAGFFLWVGMLYFLIKYDGRSAFRKTVWFLVCLFGVSFGAALYYWFVYRRFLEIAGLVGRRGQAAAPI
jgi:hypothetical protein